MTAESIIGGSCSASHDRRLFHLHNHLVDRPLLGYEARGLRLIGTATCPSDRSRLICQFHVENTAPQQPVSKFKVSMFEGIDFLPVAIAP
jgi:hypothetical protein